MYVCVYECGTCGVYLVFVVCMSVGIVCVFGSVCVCYIHIVCGMRCMCDEFGGSGLVNVSSRKFECGV